MAFVADKDKTRDTAPCSGCRGTGIYKHDGDTRKYQCPQCQGSGIHPYPVSVKESATEAVNPKTPKPVLTKKSVPLRYRIKQHELAQKLRVKGIGS